MSWTLRDMLLVLGIVVIITNVLVLWAYFARRNRGNQYGAYSRTLSKAQHSSSGSGRRHRRKRRRHNHPDSASRNPTLAETGGLPPVRPEDPARPPG